MTPKILIIGACGQIGSELTMSLRQIHGNDNVVAADIREGKDYILNDRAASILTQTLIIWGDSDTVVSPAHAQVWSRLLPNSTLIILDQTGHAPQYERPEDTALILKSFLL